MAGSLVVGDINSVDVSSIQDQVATAWVNFNGTGTVAIRDSYNVSSITDNGTGLYTANYTSALTSADVCWSVYAVDEVAISILQSRILNTAPSTSGLTVYISTTVPQAADVDYISLIVFGGK